MFHVFVLISVAIALLLTGCTYSMTNVNTTGKSNDTVDEAQTPTTSVTAPVNVPISPLIK